MNKLDKKTLLSLSSASFFDSAAICAIGFVIPIWISVFGINGFDVGVIGILGPNSIGSALGSLLGGYFSDKYGRKKVFCIGMIVFFIGFVICLFCINIYWLFFGVFLLGISSGITLPVSWTYISELSCAKDRSRNMGYTQTARSIGIVLIYVLFFLLTIILKVDNSELSSTGNVDYDLYDGSVISRLLFFALCVFCGITLFLMRNMCESNSWTSNKLVLDRDSFGIFLIKDKKSLKYIIILTCVYAPWNIVACTMSQYMPTMAATMDIEGMQYALIAIVICIFSGISVLLFPKMVCKYKYKSLYAFGSVNAVVSIVFLALFAILYSSGITSFSWLVFIFAMFWGIHFGFSAQTFYPIWASELFPTNVRGTVQGIMFFLVCFINGLWAIVAFWIFDSTNISGVIYACILMVVLLMVSCIVGIVFCPKTQNKSLDSIAKSIYN